jgi:hypothetical protein
MRLREIRRRVDIRGRTRWACQQADSHHHEDGKPTSQTNRHRDPRSSNTRSLELAVTAWNVAIVVIAPVRTITSERNTTTERQLCQ